MLPKSCRPREKRIADLTPVTCSIPGFCAITGQSKAAVLCSIDDGSLYRCAPMVGGARDAATGVVWTEIAG
jgi:hypothetical protein